MFRECLGYLVWPVEHRGKALNLFNAFIRNPERPQQPNLQSSSHLLEHLCPFPPSMLISFSQSPPKIIMQHWIRGKGGQGGPRSHAPAEAKIRDLSSSVPTRCVYNCSLFKDLSSYRIIVPTSEKNNRGSRIWGELTERSRGGGRKVKQTDIETND